jgi:predicted amidohydrolase YtcJ
VTPPELVARIAAAGIVVCPTLGRKLLPEPPPHIKRLMERTGMTWELRLDQLRDLYRGGVRLITSADSGINPGKPHGVLPSAVTDSDRPGRKQGPAARRLRRRPPVRRR